MTDKEKKKRPRTLNKAIGLCPCPVCRQAVPLHQYRAYSDNAARSRRAGKLYLLCPVDGMFQGQAYLSEHGKKTAAAKTEPVEVEPVEVEPVEVEPVEVEPADDTPAPGAGGFGFF